MKKELVLLEESRARFLEVVCTTMLARKRPASDTSDSTISNTWIELENAVRMSSVIEIIVCIIDQ